MKPLLLILVVTLFLGALHVRSQQPAPGALDALRVIEKENRALLERQKVTLEQLEAIFENARMTRIQARRS